MKKLLVQLPLLTLILCLNSCIKDEEANKECDILKAWVDGEEFKQYFTDANQMVREVSTGESEIVFKVRSTVSLPKQLPLSLEITDKATVEPASGTPQDFTQGPVTYTVTSEDGQWKRQYRVVFQETKMPSYKFSFEQVSTSEKTQSESYYHEFYVNDEQGERHNIWATGNPGFALTTSRSQPEAFPSYSIDNGYQGKGVCMQTVSTGSLGEWMQKPIAAGNLFLGRFVVENVLINPLKATQFGIPVDREPVRITGYYKYSPGKKFTNKNMKEVPGKTDEASIYAVFYRNKDEQGNSFYLHGDDVLTSPQIVKTARVSSVPPTDQWTPFEMFFEGQDVDKEKLKNNEYNLTIVFSSSKDGDLFEGAIGSTLYIDEVELSFKETEGEDQ